MEELTGRQFGPYRIIKPLGEGGMAAVYKSYQPGMDRYVALKILPRHFASDPKFVKRFELEAKIIASLQHINILPVHDFGKDQGYAYIAMPFVEQGTLADLLKGDPLPLPQITRIISQIADALDHAHNRGVVHRDIKPSNILVDEGGNCLLTDFGISKILAGSAQITRTGDVIGTPAYMSPEQGLGKDLDKRSDIYSLGVMLYEMVTGRQPFRAETPMAVIIKHIHDPLPPPRLVNPTISEQIERVVLKALAKDREHRFETAGEMLSALQEAAAQTEKKQAMAWPSGDRVPEDGIHVLPGQQIAVSQTVLSTPGKGRLWSKTLARIPKWFLGLVFLLVVLGIVYGTLIVKRLNTSLTLEVTQTVQGHLQTQLAQLSTSRDLEISTVTPQPLYTPALTNTPFLTKTPLPSLTPTPTLGVGSTRISPQDGMLMVYVPTGDFQMGSEGAEMDERPAHMVYLDAYWIDQTEVTVEQYNLCVSAGVCDISPYQSPDVPVDYYTNSSFVSFPAVDLPWQSASSYCRWAGRRLPTEAEWEKSAHGPDGMVYPWGNTPATGLLANFCDRNCDLDWSSSSSDDGYQYRSPVGSFPGGASPYGALDMAGNVWEWVADWYSETAYPSTHQENPTGPPSGDGRVVRGGSWGSTNINL